MTDSQGKVPTSRSRRTILKALAANGLAVPALLNAAPAAVIAPQLLLPRLKIALLSTQTGDLGEALPAPTQDGQPNMAARGFADPVLELIRLLRNAADMEHASLLQYSYSAFSLKAGYESISGYDSNDSMSLLAIAIEKMLRLGAVNRMLVVLGAPPCLRPPDFPCKIGGYPFATDLGPLSREALARYIYLEAPGEFFSDRNTNSPDGKLAGTICKMLGAPAIRAPSIYAAVVAVASEVSQSSGADLPDITRWIDAMRVLEDRGREGRFEYLKGLFLGSHPALAGHPDVWLLSPTDSRYPSYVITRYQTAFVQPPQGGNPTTHALARLGDLQYAIALLLLDLYFRHHISTYRSLAITHMMGPVRSVGRYLPRLDAGMPFEAIDVPDSSTLDAKRRLRFILALLHEGQTAAETIGSGLPPDYPLAINQHTMTKLREVESRNETSVTKPQ